MADAIKLRAALNRAILLLGERLLPKTPYRFHEQPVSNASHAFAPLRSS
jgi:hypothetical protein